MAFFRPARIVKKDRGGYSFFLYSLKTEQGQVALRIYPVFVVLVVLVFVGEADDAALYLG